MFLSFYHEPYICLNWSVIFLTCSTFRALSLKRKRAATTDDDDEAPKQTSKKAKGAAQLDMATEALGKEEEVTGYSLYRAGQKEQLERSSSSSSSSSSSASSS